MGKKKATVFFFPLLVFQLEMLSFWEDDLCYITPHHLFLLEKKQSSRANSCLFLGYNQEIRPGRLKFLFSKKKRNSNDILERLKWWERMCGPVASVVFHPSACLASSCKNMNRPTHYLVHWGKSWSISVPSTKCYSPHDMIRNVTYTRPSPSTLVIKN